MGTPLLTVSLIDYQLSSLQVMECYRHKFVYVNILIILYDELVFNQFFYYLFIFYVLCKIIFLPLLILVYYAKEIYCNCTGKGVFI